MKKKEPEFMQELHRIRERLTKEWRGKPTKEIAASLRRAVREFKSEFAAAHH